ncbi:SDR family oxidoreductase [Nibricoccus sp. IMCC34717]|uniref:SDR family oxidoreductase n=1 Tax=Nibricoccus sp. IMCC34717 TaxID=3034021 RepID=UPI00384CCFEC
MAKRGPVVLVTGASQGIGAEIARVFAKQLPGVRLVLVARSQTGLTRTATACRAAGAAEVETFPADVTDAAAVETLATGVLRRFKRVDVLINNAGIYRPARLLDTSVADFDAIVAANLRSVFLMCRAFVPAMERRGKGDVFNMSSIAGLKAYPGGAAYCAAKFGVTGLSQVLRAELKDSGVRVCTVHPGATWSPSWAGSGVKPERIMPARDVAQAFLDVYRLSRRTVVEEIVLRPQLGDL